MSSERILWLRLTLLGMLGGALAAAMVLVFVHLLDFGQGQLDLALALALVFTKLLASGISVGLRVPGGLIGPTLLIGGALGSAFGLLIGPVVGLDVSSPGFYATIGMVAMMGATLRAPLAALTALLELTGNPSIILPGMLAVASAELTNRLFLGKESVFESLLRIQQRTPRSRGAA